MGTGKEHLIPLKQPFAIARDHPAYNVTKDNVIHFKGSSYSVLMVRSRSQKQKYLSDSK